MYLPDYNDISIHLFHHAQIMGVIVIRCFTTHSIANTSSINLCYWTYKRNIYNIHLYTCSIMSNCLSLLGTHLAPPNTQHLVLTHCQVLTMPTRTDDFKGKIQKDVEKPWGYHGDVMVFNAIKWHFLWEYDKLGKYREYHRIIRI